MPAKSAKQKRLMDAAAHSPAFAKKVGIPQSVAMDFSEASKGKKFRKGGDMKKMNMGGYAGGGMTMVKKGGKMVPSFAADGVGKMAKGGMAEKGVQKGGVISDQSMGESGKMLSQNVKKSVPGDTVQVRGVGAARARKATIY